jgi:hypothetical protein
VLAALALVDAEASGAAGTLEVLGGVASGAVATFEVLGGVASGAAATFEVVGWVASGAAAMLGLAGVLEPRPAVASCAGVEFSVAAAVPPPSNPPGGTGGTGLAIACRATTGAPSAWPSQEEDTKQTSAVVRAARANLVRLSIRISVAVATGPPARPPARAGRARSSPGRV